jgi:hypothetical protein
MPAPHRSTPAASARPVIVQLSERSRTGLGRNRVRRQANEVASCERTSWAARSFFVFATFATH